MATFAALHAQSSFVEITVRNAIDEQLAAWNDRQDNHFGRDWTAERGTAAPLYDLLRKQLATARRHAREEAARIASVHPRHGAEINHDDVVSQLMFGAWVKVIRPYSLSESGARQRLLWDGAVRQAFPFAETNDEARISIGRQLEALRILRNRVAHHDNLLSVDVRHHLNGMLSLLAKIDPSYPALAAARSQLRRLDREDPRRSW